ncbi:hypothetical protein [Pedobacter sp. UC225_65]
MLNCFLASLLRMAGNTARKQSIYSTIAAADENLYHTLSNIN